MSLAGRAGPNGILKVISHSSAILKHLSRLVAECRLAVYSPEDNDWRPPYVYITKAHRWDLLSLKDPPWTPEGSALNKLPEIVREHLREGCAHLLLDCSEECLPFVPVAWRNLHEDLDRLGISPRTITFITTRSDLKSLLADYERTIPASDQIYIRHGHFYALEMAELFRIRGWDDPQRSASDNRHSLAHRTDHAYVCFNGRHRHHRTYLLLRLAREGLLEGNAVSLASSAHLADLAMRDSPSMPVELSDLSLDGSYTHEARLLVDWHVAGKLTLDKPSVDPQDLGATYPWYADLGDAALFRRSCFSVVPETWFDSGGCNFTEKAIKTLSMHPIILMGDVGTLAALRAQGFQTFSPVFDERYDAEPDPVLRAEMVIAEIARLVRMPRATLQEQVLAVDAARQHNARWLRSGGYYELLQRETLRPLLQHLCERVSGASPN